MDIVDNILFWYISDNGVLFNVGDMVGFKGNKGNFGEGGV